MEKMAISTSQVNLDSLSKKKKIVEPASISLVGELSPNNYLTTRISFTTPVMSGNGDGQIQLDTGETRYSLYSSSNIFLNSIPFYPL